MVGGIVALSVAGLAAVGFGVSLGVRQGALSDLEAICSDLDAASCNAGTSRADAESAKSTGQTASTLVNVFAIGGGVAAAAGISLLVASAMEGGDAGADKASAKSAVRVQAVGSVAAVYVCAVQGPDVPTVLCLRTIALAEPSRLDAVVSVQALLDRLHHTANGTWLPKPPVDLHAAWAGMLPPRSGWGQVGHITADDLQSIADAGIREIASGTPDHAGSSAVARLRAMVWSRPVPVTATPEAADQLPEIPAGAAFGAHALGFLRSGVSVQVSANGAWTRLDAPAGFVLARRTLL